MAGERSGGWFVAVTLLAGLLLAAAGNAVLIYLLDQPINWIASGVTTIIVGGFVALLLIARHDRKAGARQPPEAGFDVEPKGGFEVRERRRR